jgi:hypothetical protein
MIKETIIGPISIIVQLISTLLVNITCWQKKKTPFRLKNYWKRLNEPLSLPHRNYPLDDQVTLQPCKQVQFLDKPNPHQHSQVLFLLQLEKENKDNLRRDLSPDPHLVPPIYPHHQFRLVPYHLCQHQYKSQPNGHHRHHPEETHHWYRTHQQQFRYLPQSNRHHLRHLEEIHHQYQTHLQQIWLQHHPAPLGQYPMPLIETQQKPNPSGIPLRIITPSMTQYIPMKDRKSQPLSRTSRWEPQPEIGPATAWPPLWEPPQSLMALGPSLRLNSRNNSFPPRHK